MPWHDMAKARPHAHEISQAVIHAAAAMTSVQCTCMCEKRAEKAPHNDVLDLQSSAPAQQTDFILLLVH